MTTHKKTRKIGAMAVAALTAVSLAACSDSDDASDVADSAKSVAAEATDAAGDAASDAKDKAEDTAEKAGDKVAGVGEDIVANPPAKSWEDALKKAQADFDGKPSKIELERTDAGTLRYKIELVSEHEKHKLYYAAEDLEVMDTKTEDLGDDAAEEQQETFDVDSLIDLEDAAKKARDEQDGNIIKWKIEGDDDDPTKFEFDILPDGETQDVEVQINAEDGSAIKVDRD